MNKYDDIDFCLNILYELIYNNKTKACYVIKHINPQLIKLIDIKKDITFNTKKIFKNQDFKYINNYNSTLEFKKYSKSSFNSQYI